MVAVAKGAFILNFNNQIANNAVYQNNKYYDFKYLETKIKFKEIKIKNDSSIILFPSMSQRSLDNMLGEIESMARKKVDVGSVLKFKVNASEDLEGNVLNKWTYKNYDQFREFFAQETAPFFEPPMDSMLMDIAKPIFQDQPIVKPDNLMEYWMNTPLKNKID